MTSMIGVSLWFALVTVVPGLITVAALWGALVIGGGGTFGLGRTLGLADPIIGLSIGVALMILTQSFGVLLEERLLIKHRWLGRGPWKRSIQRELDPFGAVYEEATTEDGRNVYTIDPYEEFLALYPLLATLSNDEDAHGHFQRMVAQLFLTVNTIVALLAGVAAAAVFLVSGTPRPEATTAYIVVLAVSMLALRLVAANRLGLVGWGLWATRKRRAMQARQWPAHASSEC